MKGESDLDEELSGWTQTTNKRKLLGGKEKRPKEKKAVYSMFT